MRVRRAHEGRVGHVGQREAAQAATWPTASTVARELVAVRVAADTAALARNAADRIVVDYDPLPVVINTENAGKPDAPN